MRLLAVCVAAMFVVVSGTESATVASLLSDFVSDHEHDSRGVSDIFVAVMHRMAIAVFGRAY